MVAVLGDGPLRTRRVQQAVVEVVNATLPADRQLEVRGAGWSWQLALADAPDVDAAAEQRRVVWARDHRAWATTGKVGPEPVLSREDAGGHPVEFGFGVALPLVPDRVRVQLAAVEALQAVQRVLSGRWSRDFGAPVTWPEAGAVARARVHEDTVAVWCRSITSDRRWDFDLIALDPLLEPVSALERDPPAPAHHEAPTEAVHRPRHRSGLDPGHPEAAPGTRPGSPGAVEDPGEAATSTPDPERELTMNEKVAYAEVVDDLRYHPIEEWKTLSRPQVQQAVRDRCTAAGVDHLPTYRVWTGADAALRGLYGAAAEEHVGPDLDRQAWTAAVNDAVETVRRTRRGKSPDQLTAELGAELRRAGQPPLFPAMLEMLLAQLATPTLPGRRLDDVAMGTGVAVHYARRGLAFVQRLRSNSDEE